MIEIEEKPLVRLAAEMFVSWSIMSNFVIMSAVTLFRMFS